MKKKLIKKDGKELRRNINLNDKLYKKAQKISGTNNASAGIRLALKEYKK